MSSCRQDTRLRAAGAARQLLSVEACPAAPAARLWVGVGAWVGRPGDRTLTPAARAARQLVRAVRVQLENSGGAKESPRLAGAVRFAAAGCTPAGPAGGRISRGRRAGHRLSWRGRCAWLPGAGTGVPGGWPGGVSWGVTFDVVKGPFGTRSHTCPNGKEELTRRSLLEHAVSGDRKDTPGGPFHGQRYHSPGASCTRL